MPPKSHNKRHNAQRRPVEKANATQSSVGGPEESLTPVIATPASPLSIRPSATQSAPRHVYVKRELVRVAIVSVVTLAILVALSFILR
jgi:hypothetical protein